MDGLSSPLSVDSALSRKITSSSGRMKLGSIIKRCMHQKSGLHGLSVSEFTEEVTRYTFICANSHQSHLIMTRSVSLQNLIS